MNTQKITIKDIEKQVQEIYYCSQIFAYVIPKKLYKKIARQMFWSNSNKYRNTITDFINANDIFTEEIEPKDIIEIESNGNIQMIIKKKDNEGYETHEYTTLTLYPTKRKDM